MVERQGSQCVPCQVSTKELFGLIDSGEEDKFLEALDKVDDVNEHFECNSAGHTLLYAAVEKS